MKGRLISILFWLLQFGFISQSNGQFNARDYLMAAASDPEILAVGEKRNHIQSHNFRSPFLREVEIRGRTTELISKADDLRFRISPINPYERKAHKEMHDLLIEENEMDHLVTYNDVLKGRYQNVIQLYTLERMIGMETVKINFLNEQLNTELKEDGLSASAIKIRSDITKSRLKLEDLRSEKSSLEYEISLVYPFEGDISLKSLPVKSVNEIVLDLYGLQIDREDIPRISKAVLQYELSEAEWQIRRHKSFRNIGFIQSEFEFNQNDPVREQLGFQVGIQLPIVNPDKPDLQRRKLELIEEQNEIFAKEMDLAIQKFNYQNDLNATISKYNLVQNNLDSLSQFYPFASEAKLIIEIENYRQELIETSLELHHFVLMTYVELMDHLGLLFTTEDDNIILSGN